jgi:peptide/nickel transport system substrate-binding protein
MQRRNECQFGFPRASRRAVVGVRLAARQAIVAGATLCAVACRGAPPPPPVGTLVVALESTPAVLDPRYTTDANSSLVGALVTSGLTATDARGEAVPDLAVAWREISPLEYRFTLRPGARFHDGTPVTSADVAATYRTVLDPALRSPKHEVLAAIESIDTPDPETVIFRLREVFAPFLETTNLGILPTRLTATGPVPRPEVVGAGPFRIAGVGSDGGVDLEAHGGYMGGLPRIARLRFRVVPDGVVRALELASGTVHLVENALDPDVLPWLARQPGLELVISPGTTFQYLGMNFRDPRLADRRIRQALAYALDREAVVHHVLRDTARPATGLLPPSHWAYEGEVTRYAHDPARAGALLTESGLGAEAVSDLRRFSYKTSTVELRRRIAEVFQDDLLTIGLSLDIRSYEWATLYEDIRRGNFQLYALAWVGVTDPDVYFRIFHSTMRPPAGNNRGEYANAAMDTLLEEARRTVDRSARRRLYAEVQRLAADDLPVVPLWWTDNVVVKSRALTGFTPAPDGDLRSLATARFDGAAAR